MVPSEPGTAEPAARPDSAAPFSLIGERDRERLPSGVVDAYPLPRDRADMATGMLVGTERPVHHNVTAYRVADDRPFHLDSLHRAVKTAVARHEALRTAIDMDSYTVPMQLVHPGAAVPVVYRDLRHLDQRSARAELDAFLGTECATPFADLGRPGLLRLGAHICGEGTWWLSVTEHHAIREGGSHRSMLTEILECFRAHRDGEAAQQE